jgi:hypothetical protein
MRAEEPAHCSHVHVSMRLWVGTADQVRVGVSVCAQVWHMFVFSFFFEIEQVVSCAASGLFQARKPS